MPDPAPAQPSSPPPEPEPAAAHKDALPPGWVMKVSKSKGLPYYVNTLTNETSWDRPTDSAPPSPTAAAEAPAPEQPAPGGSAPQQFTQLPQARQPEESPKGPQVTTKISSKEWAALRRALAQWPKLEPLIMKEDGRMGIPVGWQKLESGGFVSDADQSLAFPSIAQVLEHEAARLS